MSTGCFLRHTFMTTNLWLSLHVCFCKSFVNDTRGRNHIFFISTHSLSHIVTHYHTLLGTTHSRHSHLRILISLSPVTRYDYYLVYLKHTFTLTSRYRLSNILGVISFATLTLGSPYIFRHFHTFLSSHL